MELTYVVDRTRNQPPLPLCSISQSSSSALNRLLGPNRLLCRIPRTVYSHQFVIARRIEIPKQDEIKHQKSRAALAEWSSGVKSGIQAENKCNSYRRTAKKATRGRSVVSALSEAKFFAIMELARTLRVLT